MAKSSKASETSATPRSGEQRAQLRELGARLLAARTAAKMSQAELAREAGATARFIQQIESGQGNPSYLKLRAIARALGRHGAGLLSAK